MLKDIAVAIALEAAKKNEAVNIKVMSDGSLNITGSQGTVKVSPAVKAEPTGTTKMGSFRLGRIPALEQAIVKWMKNNPGTHSYHTVSTGIGHQFKSTGTTLARMSRSHRRIKRVSRGFYSFK